ncbi:protein N-lysine methyltransferase METTL21A [Phalaenopsis equestris]|uniref:protein N-lysine methyltransferase METTL21A n=1 Tax=Phalaenopsis equestris TaxID=78828 RepID=UPI0009E2BF94|nr:protein N-lysine methyltransferase METTL21A [Phalaenopsis equestris]
MMREAAELDIEDDGENFTVVIGSYGAAVRPVSDAAAEILVLWTTNQPSVRKHNSFVRQSSHSLSLEACGHLLSILQSPSSMGTPGVTGAVMWDSGVVLANFLEHAVDSKRLLLTAKNVVELGSGCGLVGCVAALLGANVVLTDLHDRLKLLKKNVDLNVGVLGNARGSARVLELTWGDDLGTEFVETLPDFVFGSDVIYSEDAVKDLIHTLSQLSGTQTTIFLAGELRNHAVLEYFLEEALQEFQIGHIDQTQLHPEFRSYRVVLFVLVKKSNKES